jgi:hypothetical protein
MCLLKKEKEVKGCADVLFLLYVPDLIVAGIGRGAINGRPRVANARQHAA